MEHRGFAEWPSCLNPGDLLVLNDSKVIPARLRGQRQSGGNVELLLIEETAPNEWWSMAKPGKRLRPGSVFAITDASGTASGITATVLGKNAEGHCHLQFNGVGDIRNALEALGEIPLPPYISRTPGASSAADQERYQTVYARASGSVAAPTAGLHFTPGILEQIRSKGVHVCSVTLHVGPGTFAPVKTGNIKDHTMHSEAYEVSDETAMAVNAALETHRRIIAVGTTTVRVLESVAAMNGGRMKAGRGCTSIYIYPPREFQIVSALLTNFHLPQSTLLMLVSAFASPGKDDGRSFVLSAYEEAVHQKYRFFSYGDAMFLH